MKSLTRAARATTILFTALALAACSLVGPTETDGPIPLAEPRTPPLSKVNVHNPTDNPVYVKLLYPGPDLIFRVNGHTTSFLTGAIGTSTPPHLEIINMECEVVVTLDGYPERDAAGLVIISDDGAEMHRISQSDSLWKMASPVQACGMTIPR